MAAMLVSRPINKLGTTSRINSSNTAPAIKLRPISFFLFITGVDSETQFSGWPQRASVRGVQAAEGIIHAGLREEKDGMNCGVKIQTDTKDGRLETFHLHLFV